METIEADVVSSTELVATPEMDVLSSIQHLEKQLAAFKKLVGIAIQFTDSSDWVDQSGKPYLTISGADKVAAPFGINITLPAFTREVRHDAKGEYYLYTCQLLAKCRTLGVEQGFIGTASSRDKFFASVSEWVGEGNDRHKETTLKPIEEIDEGNIKKKSYTNARNNAISAILGLKNLTWEYLASFGIKKEKAARVDYGGKGATDTITENQGKLLYAKMKGKVDAGGAKELIMEDFKKEFGVDDFKLLPKNRMNDAIAFFDGLKV